MTKILITGASSGIGRAMVKEFIGQGHLVWGISSGAEKLAALENELNSEKFFWSACDVSDRNLVAGALEEMNKKNFLPDTVILNAAIVPNDLEPKFNQRAFDATFAVNFFGAVNFIEPLLEKFLERGFGHFIAIGSTAAFRPSDRSISYPATKAALALTMRGFDSIYRDKKVPFSTVYLGPVATTACERKKNFLIPTPEKVAVFVGHLLKNKKRESYFPFLSTSIFRLTKFIPDNLFFKLSVIFLKKKPAERVEK